MKFGVVTFPGSNCDQDMIDALEIVLEQKVERLWHKETDLKGVDFVVLPGGFTYGDYLRSGAIARFSPIMQSVVEHGKRGGYVLGVCNGFQILCESSLLEGALLHNAHQQFICTNSFLKPSSKTAAISKGLSQDRAVKIPIAHGEGRYFATEEVIQRMQDNDQVLFRYCDANGTVSAQSNPNGSLDNIAGICNREKNIFGMMPHPERAVDPYLGNTDGHLLFTSLLHHC